MTTRAVATLFVIVLAIGAVVSACWPKPAKAQDHRTPPARAACTLMM